MGQLAGMSARMTKKSAPTANRQCVMRQLAGFRYREIVQRLKKLGF